MLMNVRMLPAHTPAFGFEALSSAKAVSALLASLLNSRFFLTFLTLPMDISEATEDDLTVLEEL